MIAPFGAIAPVPSALAGSDRRRRRGSGCSGLRSSPAVDLAAALRSASEVSACAPLICKDPRQLPGVLLPYAIAPLEIQRG